MTESSPKVFNNKELHGFAENLKTWAKELGFAELRITDTDVSAYIDKHRESIAANLHGEMKYLERNQDLRYDPTQLMPNTLRIISARLDYSPMASQSAATLKNPEKAYIARYALGRDYHKFMRKKLTILAHRLESTIGPYGYRAFVDSAPVLERQLAEKSGLGWIGKNTLLLNESAGSWFLLGEIFTNLPLPMDASTPVAQRCGSCTACLDICPTKAFVKPWLLDARKCISYLTIEYKGPIPMELRPLIGNRIFGCDDCQIFCPWTKFSNPGEVTEFKPRHGLDDAELITLFLWTEAEFLEKTAGSPIRRAGYECWQRNLAIALGNAPTATRIVTALKSQTAVSAMVQEHIDWALTRHRQNTDNRPNIT